MTSTGHYKKDRHRSKIRLGIMCKGTSFEKWQAKCLENLLAQDDIKTELLIIDSNDPLRTILGKIKELISHPNRILFYFYMQLICRSRARRQVDMANSFEGVPSILCNITKKGKFSQYFSDADIEIIREYDLDLILRFGFGIIRGEVLNVPHYGIWSFHHGDEVKYRGGPPCFWEIYNDDDINGAILQRLTDKLDCGIVLKKGFFPTIKHSYSKTLDQSFFGSAIWPAQVCIDIRNDCAGYLNEPPSETTAPIFYIPNNLQMVLFMIKGFRNGLMYVIKNIFRHEQWNIGIVYEPIETFLKLDSKPVINWFPIQKGRRFLADPFGLEGNTGITVLCEDFDYLSGKGIISSLEIRDKSFSSPKECINLPFHMSYPYLFEHNGEVYCIPETCQAREISLYKALEFPNKWTKIGVIIKDVAGVDPTIFQYEGIWWLMYTDDEQGSALNLFVWYTPDLSLPWKPHAINPVKTDIRSVRPAGTPFMCNGYLYRPAQDYSKTTGGRIVLNRVTRLTPTEFKEDQVGFVEPYINSPFSDGLHTISAVGNCTLIDSKRWIFIPSAIKFILTKILSRKRPRLHE